MKKALDFLLCQHSKFDILSSPLETQHKVIDAQQLEIQGGGGSMGFWPNSFQGVLGVVRKSRGVHFFCLFSLFIAFLCTLHQKLRNVSFVMASFASNFSNLKYSCQCKFGELAKIWFQCECQFGKHQQIQFQFGEFGKSQVRVRGVAWSSD